jgi:hypothetical protein
MCERSLSFMKASASYLEPQIEIGARFRADTLRSPH